MASAESLQQECLVTPWPAVLVVEDEILVRVTVAGYLREAGYKVFEAADAAEARDVFTSEAVDVVFTDVQMPGAMDGLRLAHWVRKHHPETEVLVTSGKGDDAVSSGLIARDAFFSKPYLLEAVAARIRASAQRFF
jgi:DNA-binding response OmpR family regulator